jgi:predicted Zn finger-like uncharacterized protein
MSIKTHCPTCHSPYNLAESQRGKKVRCRKCANTFVVGGEDDAPAVASGKLRRDALQTSPQPPARTPPPRTKPSAVRRDRDRDDEEDDRSRRRPEVRKKSGSAVPMILLIGGGILLLFLMCGGALVIGAYFWAKGATTDTLDNFTQNVPNDPNAPFGFNPLPEDAPKDVGDALDWIRNANTAERQNKACEWLATANVDEPRKKEVDELLLKLIANANTRTAADHALGNWARAEDAPTLLTEFKTNPKLWEGGQAGGAPADALIRMQYKPHEVAKVFTERLSDFLAHGDAARRLSQMGNAVEDDVLPYMDSPKNEARDEAAKLLAEYGTKEQKKFDQAVKDLRNPDAGYERYACEYLARSPVNEARRAETAKALESALSDPNGETRKAAANALGTWAAKDNVPALIAEMDRKDGSTFEPCVLALTKLADEKVAAAVAAHLPDWGPNRDVVVKALRAMGGPVAEKAVAGYVNHSDKGVRDEAEKLMKGFGTKDDVIFEAMINDLGAKDANQRKAACEYLAKHPVDPAKQKQVDRALEPLLDDKDPFAGVAAAAANALGVWGDKDSGAALVKAMVKDEKNLGGGTWQACVDALVKLKEERAVMPLLVLVSKKDFFHKDAALKALNEMGPVVETALDNALNDPIATVGDKVAICAYLNVNVGTKASLPALQTAAMDPNPTVRNAANGAIAAIKKRNP